MPAYGFFDVRRVIDPDQLQQYRQSVSATVARHGGRYLSVGGHCDAIEGRWQPVFPVLIEFPSLQHAHRWYGSPEYRDLKALRIAATEGDAVFFDGSGMEALGKVSSGAPP
jgi:uncharacterized protein (DUF1330 family)